MDPNFRDPQGYWHAFYMNPLGIGVLADELKKRNIKEPATWADMINPAYKGLIQMPSPQASGTALVVIMTLVQIHGENKAYELMKSMNPNVQTYTQSGTGPAKSLAIGEAKIAIQFTPAFLQLMDEGYPVKVVFPTEGVGYESPGPLHPEGSKESGLGQGTGGLDPRQGGTGDTERPEDLLLPGAQRRYRRQGIT